MKQPVQMNWLELAAEVETLRELNAEMLEALKVAYDAIKSLPIDGMGSGHDSKLEWLILDEVLDKIAHAIAKARGE